MFRNTAPPIHLIVSITAFVWHWQSWVLLQMPYEPKSSHFYFVALYRKTLSVPELQEHSYYGIKKKQKKSSKRRIRKAKEKRKSWEMLSQHLTWELVPNLPSKRSVWVGRRNEQHWLIIIDLTFAWKEICSIWERWKIRCCSAEWL